MADNSRPRLGGEDRLDLNQTELSNDQAGVRQLRQRPIF